MLSNCKCFSITRGGVQVVGMLLFAVKIFVLATGEGSIKACREQENKPQERESDG